MNIDTTRAIELKQMLMARRLEIGTLLQMRSQTFRRIDEALSRLAVNQYGTCSACGLEIAERRLRALPFAVRCTRCEDRREEMATSFSRGELRLAASC